MGGWGLVNHNLVRILKTVQNVGRSLTDDRLQMEYDACEQAMPVAQVG